MFNASKFVFMNLKDYNGKKPKKIMPTDKLFLEKLNSLIEGVTNNFESYELSKAKAETEYFFWNLFCDNYLEIIKNRVYNGTKEEKESAFYALYCSLLSLLKLIAPIMPFITEEIYQNNFRKTEKDKSIHISSWPEKIKLGKKQESNVFDKMLEVISEVRQEKSKAQKSMKSEIILTLDKDAHELLRNVLKDLKAVTNASEINQGKFNVEFVE